jgi:chitinase
VVPNHLYTLSAWVEGNYAFIGETSTGASNWTPSAPTWTQLKTTFTTGPSTTSVQIYTHGWYGEGTIHVDDFSLS